MGVTEERGVGSEIEMGMIETVTVDAIEHCVIEIVMMIVVIEMVYHYFHHQQSQHHYFHHQQ